MSDLPEGTDLLSDDAELPERIGPYRVKGRLGSGGMGVVLRGYDDRLDRPVALKRVEVGGRNAEVARKRFRREARVMARLSHQNIVQVYDWVEGGGAAGEGEGDWLVMELVTGRTLRSMLHEEGPLSPERTIQIARQLVRGLATAHAAGLVHRDLKPTNVMVADSSDATDPDLIKILDFGIVKKVQQETEEIAGRDQASSLTADGGILGTVPSMSPEQAMGWPVDARSDLFSLGTLLYEMLTGISPFRREGGPMQTLSQICNVREEPLRSIDPSIPQGLADLVHRLLEKEPSRRPQSAPAVLAELDRLARPDPPPPSHLESSETVEPTWVDRRQGPETAATLVRSAPRRTRVLVAAGVLALALVAAVLVERAVQGPSRTDPASPDVAESLDAHQLVRRGLERLERYDKKGHVNEAVAHFQRALTLEPESAPALAGLADAYRLDYFRGSQDPQRLQQARAAAERAVQLDGFLARARVSLGMVYVEQGRLDEAVAEFERALELEPSNGDARYGLGRVAESRSDFNAAESHYRAAMAQEPETWYFPSRLGTLLFQAARYDEAEDAFRRHAALAADSAAAYRNLGATHYMQGRIGEAAEQFQRSLEIQADPTTYNNLGTIFFAQGLYPQAVTAFEKALESGRSNDYTVWGNLGDARRWTSGQEDAAAEAYRRALQLLSEQLEANPHEAKLRTRELLYLAKSGRCDAARTKAEEISNLPEEDAYSWFRLAVSHEVCGRRDAALAALQTALDAGFSPDEVRQDPELLELRKDVRFHRAMM